MTKRIKQDLELSRAQAGVETVGINGYIYKGGQFLPHTENKAEKMAKREEAKRKAYMSRKQQIEPYNWQLPPSEKVKPLFIFLVDYINWQVWHSTKQWELISWNRIAKIYNSFGNELTETSKAKITEQFEQWVAGVRWIER